jgi:heat shock protein HtpX
MFSGMGRRRDDNNGAPVVLVVMLVSIVVYALAFMLTRALSRYRELAADRAGAFLTAQPSALASALTKITGEMGRIPSRDLREAEPYNAFFFTPAVAPGFSLSSLFSTHPPLQKRLDQLAKISGTLSAP